jgi:hypothetical protein
MNLLPVVTAGGAVGGGIALPITELMRPQPALAAALARSAPGSLSMPPTT